MVKGANVNQRRRATDTRNGARRSFILSVLNWSQPILLALILLATSYATKTAVKTAEAVTQSSAKQDTTLGLIHRDVNSAKTKVDSLLGVERDYNAQLQKQLRALKVEPEPPQPRQAP